MNVIEILWELGLDVLEVQDNSYKVVMSADRRKELKFPPDDFDKYGIFHIFVSEVYFNKIGNLCVIFSPMSRPDEVFDMYEYEARRNK